jgi:hypothetical protein
MQGNLMEETRYRWEANIEAIVREMGLENVNSIYLAEDTRPVMGSCELTSPEKH